jgi:PAS domain S-box-containing protein
MSIPQSRSPAPDTLPLDGVSAEILIESGIVLAESLDVELTLSRVAGLTVPRLADLCVIDLLNPDGSIRMMAVAAAQPEVASGLEGVRERELIDPLGDHPVAQVIRSGQPQLLASMSDEFLRSVANSTRHARFMLDRGYHSAAVAPLLARQRNFGALSVIRMGDGRPQSSADMNLVCELARRSALALDNARLFSEAREVEQRLAAILVTLAEAITLTDETDRIVFANQAAADLFGVETPEDLAQHDQGEVMRRFLILDEHGRELDPETMPRRRLFAGAEAKPQMMRSVNRSSGEERWLIAKPAPIHDPQTGRLQFAVNVYEDITEVKRVQVAESFMAEASRVLASSADHVDVLQRVARLAVPQIADWCSIEILSEDGEIECVAIHHADRATGEPAGRAAHARRGRIDDATVTAEVMRSGRAQLLETVGQQSIAPAGEDPPMPATSAIVVPLAAPTRTVGAITLAFSDSLRRFSPADVTLAERLGRRAGTAVESSRLHTERTRIAKILQASLLPDSLPEIAGVKIAARYHAAGELNDVGGDFYDVIPYRGESWLLVIGDVCGKGPRAAAVTALARHTLRTASMLGQTPAGMLHTLHRALSNQPPGADLCTACIVTLERLPAHVALTVTLAGHPPPLLIGAEGRTERIGKPGTLLGVLDPIETTEVRAELLPGQTLLLYTDGLPEAGHAGEPLGDGGLARLCAQEHHLPLEELLGVVEQTALEHAAGTLSDDIALLGLRLSG